jgi:hypothetical protein
VGAGTGAAGAALTGGNVAQGAEMGAAGGAVSGGISGGLSGLGGGGVSAATPGASAAPQTTGAPITDPNLAAAAGMAPGAPPAGAGPSAGAGPAGAAGADGAPQLSGPDIPQIASAPVPQITASPLAPAAAAPSSSLGASGGLAGTSETTTPATAPLPGSQTASLAPSTGSGALATPSDSTLPGNVGAGAAAPGGAPASTSAVTSSGQPAPAPQAASTLTPTQAGATPAAGAAAPTAAPTPAPAPASHTSGLGSFFSNPKNDLTLAAFGADLLLGNRPPAYESQLQHQATSMAEQGQMMRSYLNSGTLPPGMQETLNAATAASKAAIRSNYAARGMTGSSAQIQDMNAAAEREAAQANQIASQLFQQGLSESEASNQIYLDLMNTQMQQDQAMSQSVGKLVAALVPPSPAPQQIAA